jgi:hypothetical protein
MIPLLALMGLVIGIMFQVSGNVNANPSNRDTVYMQQPLQQQQRVLLT